MTKSSAARGPVTHIVSTSDELRRVQDLLMSQPDGTPVGFDTEAHGPVVTWRKKTRLIAAEAHLTGFSLSLDNAAWYVPVAHLETRNVPEEEARETLSWLVSEFSHSHPLWAHHWGFDLQILRNFGALMPSYSDWLYDSLVAAWLAGWGHDPRQHKSSAKLSLALKEIAKRRGYGTGDTFESLAEKRQANEIPVDEMAPYAARDAWLTKEVGLEAWAELVELDLVDHFREVDMPLVEVVRDIEEWGTPIDANELGAMSEEFRRKVAELGEEFERRTETMLELPVKRKVRVGTYKNGKPKMLIVERPELVVAGAHPSKDAQVSRWCYDELKLWPTDTIARNQEGNWPTGKELIVEWANLPGEAGEIASLLLEYRKYSKLLSTYVKPMLEIPPQYADGHLHTSYKITGTMTQRFSSAAPNLQNIPSRSEEGKRIRKAMVARPGWQMIVMDYSQIELRLAAHLSQDEEMVMAYVFGEDIHQGTLERMQQSWPGAIRTDAKVTNFSTIYRISARALARKMRCKEEQAQASIDAFYARFGAMSVYHVKAIAYALAHGYARTIDGYKRTVDTRLRRGEMEWSAANESINTPIQGSAAGLAKIAMRNVHRRWVRSGVYGNLVHLAGQEHDSLIAEARDEFVTTARDELKWEMEHAWELRVPLVAEGGIGKSWAEAKG